MKPFLLVCVIIYVVQGDSDHPPGHFKPLGSHQDPEEPITELHEAPLPQEFFENFVKPGKPALFRGAAKKMPSFSLWTDEYLRYTISRNMISPFERLMSNVAIPFLKYYVPP